MPVPLRKSTQAILYQHFDTSVTGQLSKHKTMKKQTFIFLVLPLISAKLPINQSVHTLPLSTRNNPHSGTFPDPIPSQTGLPTVGHRNVKLKDTHHNGEKLDKWGMTQKRG